MLLARLECEHKSFAAVPVLRSAYNAAGHLSDEFTARGHNPEVWPAEGEIYAEALAFTHCYVKTHLARRFEDSE